MNHQTIAVADLSLDPSNVRKHSRRNLDAIKASLRKFGQQKPIVVDAKGIVLAGNGTLTAAQELGWTKIQIVRTELAGVEATAFAIADNRTAELAEWDEDGLAKVLESLKVEDADLLAATGYDAAEVDKMSKAEVTEDEVPEPPVDPITKLGDLWILGEHRVLCGDSTKAEDVERLMNGAKADMVFSDPPYNISFGGTMSSTSKDGKLLPYVTENSKHDAIHNDRKSPQDFQDFIRSVISIIQLHCLGAYYISFCSGNFHELLAPVASSIGYKSIIIWVKNQSPMGGGAYRRRYEPIIYGNFSGDFYGTPYSEDDVWEFNRTKKNDLHPTMKPVELVANAISHGSKLGGSVLDLFIGSGTTLIAAEQLGRKCYGMEISPAYCDVIVQRWENLTGKKAVLEKPTI
jgi:DNA modification methylase